MSTDIKAKHFKLIGADTTHIAAAQTLGGAGNFTLANTTIGNLPQTITFTSTGNISGVEMTITGTDLNGDAQTEAINGPNNNTVTSTNKFLTVTQVAADGAVSTNTSIGITGTAKEGILTPGRTRIRGLHGVSSSTAGSMVFRNTSTSGSILLELDTPNQDDFIDPYIPDDGVLFDSGSYLNVGDGVTSVTVFFDG
jgi:hypothetical protein